MFSFPLKKCTNLKGCDVYKHLSLIENDSSLDFATNESSNYGISVDIWIRGSVNTETLMNRLVLSFRQSFCDFLIEQVLKYHIW